jgi:Mrp family chromosome partitioning ATPase
LSDRSVLEPTLTRAIRRHRWLFLANVVVCVGIAGAYVSTRTVGFEATASVVVQDPRTTKVFDNPGYTDPKRYVADQAAIFQSNNVAAAAAAIIQSKGFPAVTDRDVSNSTTVTTSVDSSQITIRYQSPNRDIALAGATAMLDAYQGVKRAQGQADVQSSIAKINDSIAAIDKQLTQAVADVAAARQAVGGPDAAAITAALKELQTALAGADPAGAQAQVLASIASKLQGIASATDLQSRDPSVVRSLDNITNLTAQRSALAARGDQLQIDAELGTSGIVLSSPPNGRADQLARGTVKTVGIGAVLGLLLGTGSAYLLAVRRRQFDGRLEPEVVLDAPLLADVPDFRDEKIESEFPVISNPLSASAEALRFAAAAMGIRSAAADVKTFALTSAAKGDGKTTVLANAAFALAQAEKRVLVIDGDQEHGSLTRLLLGDHYTGLGLADLNRGKKLDAVVHQVTAGDGATFSLIPRSAQTVEGVDALATEIPLAEIRKSKAYDIILVDCPPLLQIAQAGSLMNLADQAVIVVNHGGSIVLHEEIVERLRFIGTPVLGYIYNRAPLRPEIASYYLSESAVRHQR